MRQEESGRMKSAAQSKWGTVLFHVFLLFGVLAMIYSSLAFTQRARLLPLMIGVPTVVLLLLSLARDLRPDIVRRIHDWLGMLLKNDSRKTTTGLSSLVEQDVPPASSFFVGGAWFCLLLVLVLFLGFLFATIVFVPCFLLVFARYAWGRVLLYTAVLFVIEWYGFELLLGLKLWHGMVPEIVPGFIGGGILPPLF
jgi:hypothetical protein